MRIIVTTILWATVIAALWLTVASGAFLWLAGLWDSPRIVWWARPWQWLVYVQHGDGSWSEDLYLVVAAVVATSPAVAYVRFFLSSPFGATKRPLLYGKTGWASREQMRQRDIDINQRPF